MTAPTWPVISSNSLKSVMAVDVGDEKMLCLVRQRVRKQSIHTVYGLVFHPRGPSLYRWNCFLQIGQGDCFNGLAGEGLREDEPQFLLIVVAFWSLKAEATDTSWVGIAFRAISLLLQSNYIVDRLSKNICSSQYLTADVEVRDLIE